MLLHHLLLLLQLPPLHQRYLVLPLHGLLLLLLLLRLQLLLLLLLLRSQILLLLRRGLRCRLPLLCLLRLAGLTLLGVLLLRLGWLILLIWICHAGLRSHLTRVARLTLRIRRWLLAGIALL